MNIFTIGFTKKSARTFFTLIRESGAGRLIDVRLNNVSQLAGFAKRDDLRYLLSELCAVQYSHELLLAPTQEMLDGYKKLGTSWRDYEQQFLHLLGERHVENVIPVGLVDNAVLLCSEATAHQCHRRLVAEYLADHWGGVSITHL
ncbi:MAG: hypothetical protein JWM49_899 [Microbacteriaceae bacterium]|nr:hypothetical protein [Microbacteriaceae bacterium]